MSTVPLSVFAPPTLADLVDQALDDGLAAGAARCLWCGGDAAATVADRWTGRVVLRCTACGSELEGLGRRRGREVRS
jgi:hypothetical protein